MTSITTERYTLDSEAHKTGRPFKEPFHGKLQLFDYSLLLSATGRTLRASNICIKTAKSLSAFCNSICSSSTSSYGQSANVNAGLAWLVLSCAATGWFLRPFHLCVCSSVSKCQPPFTYLTCDFSHSVVELYELVKLCCS